MDVHGCYLFMNVGQNPLKRFFSLGIVLMKHFRSVSVSLLPSVGYETL